MRDHKRRNAAVKDKPYEIFKKCEKQHNKKVPKCKLAKAYENRKDYFPSVDVVKCFL